MGKHILKASENSVVRRELGSKREEVTGRRTRLFNEKPPNYFLYYRTLT
jgi:hypothetical protein